MELKKYLFLLLTISSFSVFADRGWVGGVQVETLRYTKSSNECGPSSGACMVLYFKSGSEGCPSIAIRNSEDVTPFYKQLEALALVSITAGKKLRIYVSREYCMDADKININNIDLY